MTDVFISYAKTNQASARRLAEAVQRAGYGVWWDEELPPHLSYSDVIAERIGAAKAAIVVWSEAAAASQWVRAEADMARTQNKLVQTSIDGRMPPMPFNQIQFAAIGDWQGEEDHPGWQKVKASLAALAGPREAAAPPAAQVRAAPPTPTPRRGAGLVAVLAGLLLVAALLAFYLLRPGAGSPPPGPVATPAMPPPAAAQPPPAATPEPRPARNPPAPPVARQAARPQQRGELRRHCLGPGRGTPQCRELRARNGRRR